MYDTYGYHHENRPASPKEVTSLGAQWDRRTGPPKQEEAPNMLVSTTPPSPLSPSSPLPFLPPIPPPGHPGHLRFRDPGALRAPARPGAQGFLRVPQPHGAAEAPQGPVLRRVARRAAPAEEGDVGPCFCWTDGQGSCFTLKIEHHMEAENPSAFRNFCKGQESSKFMFQLHVSELECSSSQCESSAAFT